MLAGKSPLEGQMPWTHDRTRNIEALAILDRHQITVAQTKRTTHP